jgi:predicted transcriptional regulator
MPITGFNEIVEELKLIREQFKDQEHRQVAEQLKREQLEKCIEDLQQRQVTEQLKREQLETYIEDLLNRPVQPHCVNELPNPPTFFEEVFQKQND